MLATFLDIGSGFGQVVFHFASETSVTCYGFEIVPRRLQYCQELKGRLSLKFMSDE